MRKMNKSHLSYQKIYKEVEDQEVVTLEKTNAKCIKSDTQYDDISKSKTIKPPKFKKGKIIRSLDELMEQQYIFYKGKLYSREWFKFWELQIANQWVRKCRIYSAISLNKAGEN